MKLHVGQRPSEKLYYNKTKNTFLSRAKVPTEDLAPLHPPTPALANTKARQYRGRFAQCNVGEVAVAARGASLDF